MSSFEILDGITNRKSYGLKSWIVLVYFWMLTINWCFDPALDHHQGDGNSLLHQVASCYSSHSGLIPQSRVGLNCHSRNEVKTPAAMGGSASAIWPGIQLTTMQTTGKQTSLVPATPVLFWHNRSLIGGTARAYHSLELVLTATRETR